MNDKLKLWVDDSMPKPDDSWTCIVDVADFDSIIDKDPNVDLYLDMVSVGGKVGVDVIRRLDELYRDIETVNGKKAAGGWNYKIKFHIHDQSIADEIKPLMKSNEWKEVSNIVDEWNSKIQLLDDLGL